jgi:hypothetical protein
VVEESRFLTSAPAGIRVFVVLFSPSRQRCKNVLSPVRTRAHFAIEVERLISGDMSQRHETPIHPSTFYVKMLQGEVLLTCAAYITMHLAEKKSKRKKRAWIRKITEIL